MKWWLKLCCALLCCVALHRRRASSASCAAWEDAIRRRWSRGRRSSEAGVQGGGRCTAQFVIALWPLTLARALSALTWETWWPQRKAIFYTMVITFVIIPTVPTVRPTTWDFFFMDILMMGRKHKQMFFFSFVLCFFAQTLWLHMWKATPYTVSMQYWPPLSPVGVCVTDPRWVVGIIH